ncbi:MAG: hypothetical protein BGN82_06895 [Alphaproteobacteria bacterium 65-7]|nr:MAG: hypothetical protein BGN82_06895 [Alphaproteobacteria bacterium 65-7]
MRLVLMMIFLGSAAAPAQPLTSAAPSTQQVRTVMSVSVTVIDPEPSPPPKTPENKAVSR